MDKGKIVIRKAVWKNVDDVFRLYIHYMFDSYLLNFGAFFIKRYLEKIIKSSGCVTLLAEDTAPVGFIAASLNSKKTFFSFFFDFKMLCIWMKKILIQPGLLLKSIEPVFYPFKTHLKSVNSELLFIAVEPLYQKRNIGTSLISEVLTLMRERGVKKVKVSTFVDNKAVNRLLEKMDFKVKKTFMMFRKKMFLYEYQTR